MNETVKAYMYKATGVQREMFEQLHNLITELYPKAEINVSYGVLMHKNGKKWVALGYRKDGVSLYTEFPNLISAFKNKHPKIKTGKGCLNFRFKDQLPVDDIKTLVTAVMNS